MRRRLTIALFIACAALAALPAPADQPPIVRLRIDGFGAAADAMGRVGVPGGDATLLGPIVGQLGLDDIAWVDRGRPAAVVLPFAGMTAGAGGMVAVLPYAGERAAALAALGTSFDEMTESSGVYRLVRDGGASIALIVGDGHFVIGSSAGLVRQVDALAALAPGDLPRGAVALEVELEAVAPIIQLGLMQGRQMMARQMAAEDGAQAVPNEFLDFYFDGVRDLVNNTSRLQMSIDATDDRLAVHTRLIPRGGSTLAAVVAAQKGGLPRLLKQIDADGAQLLYAGQLTFTDALDEALAGYTASYTSALRELLAMLEQSGGAGAAGIDAVLELLGPDALADWQACRAGEYAGRMEFGGEMEVRMLQLSRLSDAGDCLALAERFSVRAKKLSGDELPISITPGALVHRGAQALRIDLDVASLSQYFGFAGSVAISTLGPDGEQRFKAAVDRALDGRKKRDGRAPDASDFAPLDPAAGMLISVDLGAIAAAMPTQGDTPAPAVEGRLVAGARFIDGRLDIDVSMPAAVLEAMRELSGGVGAAEMPQPAPTTSGSAR